MDYHDTFFSREDRYSIGIERTSGQCYVSIAVSTGVLDYEEYYRIPSDRYEALLRGKDAAVAFAEACRRHEHDHLLIEKPGWNRGTPV